MHAANINLFKNIMDKYRVTPTRNNSRTKNIVARQDKTQALGVKQVTCSDLIFFLCKH